MRSLILGTAVMAVSALLSPAEMAPAADLKVLSSVALTSVLDEFTPAFEKATGDKLNIGYGLAAELKKRVLDGETADVIILTRPMLANATCGAEQGPAGTNDCVPPAGAAL